MNRNRIVQAHKTIIIGTIITVGLLAAILVFFSALWLSVAWKNVDLNVLIFDMKTPVAGTSSSIIVRYFLCCILPSTICVLLYWIAVRKTAISEIGMRRVAMVLSAMALVCGLVLFEHTTGLFKYMGSQHYSSFIDDNYCWPQSTDIKFPENKRNLICIYVESAEVSFSDTVHGGASSTNYIPELTEMAQNGECFSAGSSALNGGGVITGMHMDNGGDLRTDKRTSPKN